MCQCGKPLEGGCSSVPGCKQNVPHKHAAVIKAWADGKQIQISHPKLNTYGWQDWKPFTRIFGYVHTQNSPTWSESWNYRIKPEPKPDRILYSQAAFCSNMLYPLASGWMEHHMHGQANVKAIFDGETGVLKSVEKI